MKSSEATYNQDVYDSLNTMDERAEYLLNIGVTATEDDDNIDYYKASVGSMRLPIKALSANMAIAKGIRYLESKLSYETEKYSSVFNRENLTHTDESNNSEYDLRYTVAKLKKAYNKKEVSIIVTNSNKIIFYSRDGLKNGIVIDTAGLDKMYPSENHAQHKIDSIKGHLL